MSSQAALRHETTHKETNHESHFYPPPQLRKFVVLSLVVPLFSVIVLLVLITPTHASPNTTYSVNSPLDEPSANPNSSNCISTPSAVCTLRAAIQAANFNAGPDTIMLPAGIYALTIPGANEDNAATGDLDIKGDLTIMGDGSDTTIVDGNQLDRVFDILNSSRVNISGLTIRNGGNVDYGGGIRSNGGFLLLSNSAFTSNTAGQGGGGVFSTRNLTVTSSLFLTNTALRGGGINVDSGSAAVVSGSIFSGNKTTSGSGGNTGGAIFDFKATLAVNNTSLSNNSADNGGAVINDQGTLSVAGSTFYNNTARYGGGALFNDGTSIVTNTTFSGNTANSGSAIRNIQFGMSTGVLTMTNSTVVSNTSTFGGEVARDSGTLFLANVIVAFGSPNNCSGTITSLGHNLDSGNTCGFGASGDLINTNPLLGPLQNNGGATPTHALLAGSPAIDAGDDVGCPATDQRGIARPQGAHCDIGAYEYSGNVSIYLPLIVR